MQIFIETNKILVDNVMYNVKKGSEALKMHCTVLCMCTVCTVLHVMLELLCARQSAAATGSKRE